MSAIGGRVDFHTGTTDTDSLIKMGRIMSLRGRRRSSLYVDKGVGIIFNSSSPDAFGANEDKQPAIYLRGENTYALAFDSDELYSSAVFEKYRTDGIDFLSSLRAPFAIALYDGARKMLLLARDKEGRRPLFYRIMDGKIFFASEIKGILAATDERAAISREMFSLHVTAPMGVYRAANIYCDVNEVLAGECLLFTELGISRFRYRDGDPTLARHSAPDKKRGVQEEVREPFFECGESFIEDSLSEALIAFDYPQFDAYMPSLCRTLEKSARAAKYYLKFGDPIRKKSISYAREREDRLGGFYGIRAQGIVSNAVAREEDLRTIHRYLLKKAEALGSEGFAFLSGIIGKRRIDFVMNRIALRKEGERKSEDTESEIRILGMLCQTVMWGKSQKLLFKSCGDEYFQSALSMM